MRVNSQSIYINVIFIDIEVGGKKRNESASSACKHFCQEEGLLQANCTKISARIKYEVYSALVKSLFASLIYKYSGMLVRPSMVR